MLAEQIPEALSEIEYLESVRSSVENADSVAELGQIRRELSEQGYVKQRGKQKFSKQKKPRPASRPNTSPPTVSLFLWAKTISKTTL